MPVTAVADTFDRTAGSTGALVQAVLDGVPGKRFADQLLGGGVDLASPQRPIGRREHLDHGLLNSTGPTRNLALYLD